MQLKGLRAARRLLVKSSARDPLRFGGKAGQGKHMATKMTVLSAEARSIVTIVWEKGIPFGCLPGVWTGKHAALFAAIAALRRGMNPAVFADGSYIAAISEEGLGNNGSQGRQSLEGLPVGDPLRLEKAAVAPTATGAVDATAFFAQQVPVEPPAKPAPAKK